MKLTTEAIRNHVGATAFIRGRDYFIRGKVEDITIDSTEITGLVQGSEQEPYKVVVEVQDGEIIDSECSCPVEYECKHVAALCLKALPILVKQTDTANNTKKEVGNSTLQEDWKQKFYQIIDKKREAPHKMFQLQMLLKIEEHLPYNYLQLLAQNSHKKIVMPRLEQKLLLRPRIFDAETNKYSASEITWSSGMYGTNSIYWNGVYGEIKPEQFTFLQMMTQVFDRGYHNGWMSPSEEKSLLLWKLLSRAAEFGVELLGGQKGQIPIELSNEPLQLSLEVTEAEDSFLLSKKVCLKEKEVTDNKIILIGEPAHLAIWEQSGVYLLHSVVGGENSGALKELDKPLIIPKQDRQVFEQFLPKLTKQYQVNLKTSAMVLPEVVIPRLAIQIKREKKMQFKAYFNLIHKNTFLPLLNTPESVVVQNKTVLFDAQRISQIREALNRQFALIPWEFYPPYPFVLRDGMALEGINAARFSSEIIPKLQEALPDLVVLKDDGIPDFTFDKSVPKIAFNVEENELEHDWFDLGVTVSIGSEKVPFPQLFSALVDDQEYLLLESGLYFSLKNPQFDQLRKLIAETKTIQESEGQRLQISRFQAGLWDELQRLGIVIQQAEKWRETMQGLLNVKKMNLENIPVSLQATLRPYQHEGYSWLKFLHKYHLGGILADDMGLGKTIQTISLIIAVQEENKKKRPFLIVAPTSVVENWDNELERFSPFLMRVILRAGDRSQDYQAIKGSDIVVTSYALLVRDFDQLKKFEFDTLILDEAQMVKNYQSKAYAIVRQMKTESKIALSGTPLENNLMELWSIFSIVAPGLFPDPKKFQEIYKNPIEKHQDTQTLNKLRSRIRPLMMRRQKAVVEKQLPAKNEQIIYLNLNEKHRHLYDLQLQQERKRVLGLMQEGGLKNHRFEILRSLMKMRQMCLHPHLVDRKHTNIPATKIDALKEYIEEIVAEDHKILIFSQFTSFLSKIKEMLDQLQVAYLYLDGQTKNRGELVKSFQTGKFPIFVISLKSGGFGLNLTAADYCILLDPWWNPAVEQQAVDRAHRIGQTKPVFVYKMIAKDTIEEKVLQLQQKKQKLFQNIMEDDNLFGSVITEEDIHKLFEL